MHAVNKEIKLTLYFNNRIYSHGCDCSGRFSSISMRFLFSLMQKCHTDQTKLLRFILCKQKRHYALFCAAFERFGKVQAGGREQDTCSSYDQKQMVHMAPAPQRENLSAEPQLRSHCKSESSRGGGGGQRVEEENQSYNKVTVM